VNKEALAHWGLLRQKQKTVITSLNFNQQLSPLYQWSIPAVNIFFVFTEQHPL
jgi:hypothetical protein